MPKNRQLMLHNITQNLKVFIKFSRFAVLIFLVACKSDQANNEGNTSEKSSETETEQVENNSSKKIIVFGDSLTAGYGLEDVNNAFPGIIQDKIEELELNYTVVNSGVSGETTSGGKNRIEWVLNEKPDIFILELGANDGLRGVPIQQTKANLQYIIDAVKQKYPTTKIILAGMQLPPNMGKTYTEEFKGLFPELAEKNGTELIPFLLENVGGIAALNQSDGIHPTEEGHEILATNVWTVLQPILN